MLLSAIWHWVWRFTVIQNTLEGIRFHFRLSGMGYYINMSFIPPERLGFRGDMLILLLLSSTLNNWIEKRASTVFFYRVFAKIFTICFTLHPPSTCSHTTQKVTKEAFLQALSFSINRSIKKPGTGTIWSASSGFACSKICHPPFTAWGPWHIHRSILKTSWWEWKQRRDV